MSKGITAYKIDPQARTVLEIEWNGKLEHLYQMIGNGCSLVECLQHTHDDLVLDEKILLRGGEFRHFIIGYGPDENPMGKRTIPLAGSAIVVGRTPDGDWVRPTKSLQFYRNRVRFEVA